MKASINTKFMLVHVLMLFVPICLMGILVTVLVRNEMETRIRRELDTALGSVKTEAVDRHLSDMAQALTILSQDPDLWKVFDDREIRAMVTRDWSLVQRVFPERSWIYYGDERNRLMVSPDWNAPIEYDCTSRPWYTAAKERAGIAWSGPYLEYVTSRMVFTASTVIRDASGTVAGVLAIDTFIHDFLDDLEVKALDEVLRLLVVTADNRMIELNRTGSPAETGYAPAEWNRLLNTPDGSMQIALDGERYYAAVRALAPLPLHLVSLVPRHTAMKEIRQIMRIIGLVFVIGLAVLALGHLYIASFVIGSIRKLNSYMRRIASGDLTIRTLFPGHDEFRSLNGYLNTMVAELSARIRRQKEMNGRLTDALAQKEALARTHSSLIHIFSHNTGTPITYLLHASGDLLKTEPDNEEYRIINQAAWDLKWLSENIMTYLKINEGTEPLEQESISIPELTGLLVRIYTPLAAMKNLRFELDAPEHGTISGTYFMIRMILENMIDNAVKYSFGGGTIGISIACDGHTIRWNIRDSGPGFTVEDRAQLFTKFRTLSARPTGSEISTGLGLYLVRELLSRQGGEIELAETPAGEGALFRVLFRQEARPHSSLSAGSHALIRG